MVQGVTVSTRHVGHELEHGVQVRKQWIEGTTPTVGHWNDTVVSVRALIDSRFF